MGNVQVQPVKSDSLAGAAHICERAIIDACLTYRFSNKEAAVVLVPEVLIEVILQFSGHWQQTTFEPEWSSKEKKKSKYLRIYDIHCRQLRLELLDMKGKVRSSQALKTTHFNRFESALNTDRKFISYSLTFFHFTQSDSFAHCPVLEGFIRIGFVSNMYCSSNGKKLYKKYRNKQDFDEYLSNGHCFVGLLSQVVFDENIFGLYMLDGTNETRQCLEMESPIKPDEKFEIIVETNSGRVVIKRLFERDKEGKTNCKQYPLYFPTPMQRFKNEEWYPMISINPYKASCVEIGCQLNRGTML